MPYATAKDGTRLFYRDYGKGTPVALLHGWPLSGDTFESTALALADKGYRSIIVDRRGFGRSDQPWDGYDYDTFTDDLKAILDEAGINEKVALVGFSMGGGEVARFQTKYPGKTSAAVLIASVVPYMLKTDDNPDGTPQSTFDDMTKKMKEDRAAFMTGFAKDFFGVGMIDKPVSQEVLDDFWRQAMNAGHRATLESAGAFATTDFRPDLPNFDCPTLIIHGTKDVTVPIDASARAAAKGIAGSTLVEYDGEAHGLFATQTERLNGDLVRFLEENVGATTRSAIPMDA